MYTRTGSKNGRESPNAVEAVQSEINDATNDDRNKHIMFVVEAHEHDNPKNLAARVKNVHGVILHQDVFLDFDNMPHGVQRKRDQGDIGEGGAFFGAFAADDDWMMCGHIIGDDVMHPQ